MTTMPDIDTAPVPARRVGALRDRRGSWVPTGRMITTRIMELRKRRGLMIASSGYHHRCLSRHQRVRQFLQQLRQPRAAGIGGDFLVEQRARSDLTARFQQAAQQIHFVRRQRDGFVFHVGAAMFAIELQIAGLEKALEGKQDGNTLAVSVPPAEGYGTHDAALIQRVPKRSMQGSGEIKKGMQFQASTEQGVRVFTVTAVVGDMVTLDGNHPLADQTLHFNVEIVNVREATAEELEHGHVHGAGGHHH